MAERGGVGESGRVKVCGVVELRDRGGATAVAVADEVHGVDDARACRDAASDRHCRPHNIAAGCCVMSEGLAAWLPSKSVPVGEEDREEEGDSEEKDERGSRVWGVFWGEGR